MKVRHKKNKILFYLWLCNSGIIETIHKIDKINKILNTRSYLKNINRI